MLLDKKQRRWLGSILLLISLSLILPIPDILDVVGFKIFSVYKGIELTAENLPLYYFDYLVVTFFLGVAALFFGLHLLGKNWKYLKKKLNIGRYWIGFLIAILVVIFVAYIDIKGMVYWASFSTIEEYTLGLQGYDFWLFFKSIVNVLFLILPLAYYFIYRRDKSEAFSLYLSEMILFWFGFADLMYFVLQRKILPSTLIWLNNHPIIGTISRTLGYSDVGPLSLTFSVVLGFILAYGSAWILKNKF